MRGTFEILALATQGDEVRMTAQGTFQRAADWRPMASLTIDLPPHAAQKLVIGQRITLSLTPGKKP